MRMSMSTNTSMHRLLGHTLSLALLAGLATSALAQEHAPPTHDSDLSFQVTFHRDAVLLSAADASGKPVDLSEAHATVKLEREGQEPATTEMAWMPGHHGASGHLRGALDLSQVEEGGATAAITLHHLPGGKTAELKAPFHLAPLARYVCPMSCVKPSDQPGRCSACGMALKEQSYLLACPMHPSVTSREEGATCWKCHMKLVPTPVKAAASPPGGHPGHGGHGEQEKAPGGTDGNPGHGCGGCGGCGSSGDRP